MQDICEEIELDYGPFKNRLNVETGVPNDTSKYLPSIKEEGENDDQIGEFVATPTRTLSSPKTTERFTRKVRINLNDTNLLEAQACCSDPLRNCLQGVDSLDAFELNRHTTQSTFEANIKLTSTIKEITIVLLNKFDWMSDRYTTLGSLEIDMIETTLSSLRTLILKNVLYLPEDFSFLHKDRDSITYILRNQEEYKTACDLINWDGLKEDKGSIFIQSSAPKLKIGIVECTGAGVCLGSIICNRDDILSNLRQVIDTHFKQLTSIIDEGGNLYARLKNFIFLDERFWPITPQQELSIAVHSIIGKNQTIAIKSGSLADTMAYVGREKLHFSLADGIDTKCDTLLEVSNNQKSNHTKQSSNSPLILGSKNTLKERRNWKFKDLSFKNISFDVGSLKLSIDGEQSRQMRKAKKEYRRGTKTMKEDQKKTFDNNRKINKQVMISYVRREAAVHALYLKSALERLGLTVYLDVHEIKSGSDWQDSLNDAISGCLVFVPLVTSSYGQTLWSNREIKLADVLKKHIIPVNFGQSWPPACLAIQFATTQYICWKPNDDCILGDDASKINHWPKECILEVAVLIKNNLRIAESSSLGTNNLEDSSTECVIDYAGSKGHSFLPDLVETMNQDRTRRVAISHHQNDGLVANKIKDVLQQNHYQVWLANCNSTKGTAMPMTKCNSSGYSAESSHFLDSYESSNKNYLVHERYRQSCSTLYGSCSTLNGCWKLDSNHYEDFLENIAECSLVVLIGSREYFESSMSMIHVFYCESRKPIILIKVDNNNYYIPHDFKMLIKDIVTIEMDEELLGNGVADKNSCNGKYKLLLSCVESIIQTKANDGDNIKIGVCSDEDRLNELMLELKKSIPQRDNCVFLADGLEDIDLHRDPNIQQVCIHLGMELAKMRDLIIVTSGRTLGPANLIANTFVSCRTRDCVHEANGKQMDRNCICLYRITTNNDGNKLNFTSHCDNRETSQLRKQSSSIGMRHMNNELADGKSINLTKDCFFDITDEERCTISARAFDVCLLIGWHQNKEAQKFVWTDHFIIPVLANYRPKTSSTSNDETIEIVNKNSQNDNIVTSTKVPMSIDEHDWNLITKSGYYRPMELSRAICNAIINLKRVSNMTQRLDSVTLKHYPDGEIIGESSPSTVSDIIDDTNDTDSEITILSPTLNDGIINQTHQKMHRLMKRLLHPFANSVDREIAKRKISTGNKSLRKHNQFSGDLVDNGSGHDYRSNHSSCTTSQASTPSIANETNTISFKTLLM